MRIEVIEEDIKKGVPKNTTLCPVALAIKRAIPEEYHKTVSVQSDECFFSLDGKILNCYSYPDEVVKQIDNFDWFGLGMEPFSFEIEVV